MQIPKLINQEASQPRIVDAAVSFEDFKTSLGAAATKYTDQEIERMRLMCDQIADVVFDTWLVKRNAAL